MIKKFLSKMKDFLKRFWRIIVPITAAAGIGAAVVTTPIYTLPDYLNENIGCVKNANGDWVAFDLTTGKHESKVFMKDSQVPLVTVDVSTPKSDEVNYRFIGKKKDAPCVFFEGKSLTDYSNEEKNKLFGTKLSFVNNAYAALSFNAATDKVDFGSNSNYNFASTDIFTVEMWVNYTATTGCGNAIQKGTGADRWQFLGYDCVSAGTFLWFHGDDVSSQRVSCAFDRGGSAMDDGAWHHVAIVHISGSTCAAITAYVDGISRTLTQNDTGAATTNTENMTISDGTNGCAAGCKFDELRIWNYARSADLIAGNMWLRIPDQEGLIGYWRLDEGTGATNAVRPYSSHASSTNVFGTLTSVDWVDSAPINYPE